MTNTMDYALGSTDAEHERLMVQARFIRPWTERFLRAGGLVPGMSVLDLGSGIGDVTMLAAGIVGPEGHVTGIDRDEVITGKARQRIRNESMAHIASFEVADLADYEPDELLDAVIGRFVLLYQKDPAAILRRYARFVRPGGVLIFHDLDFTRTDPSWPACPQWDDCYRLIGEAFRATGALPDLGRRFSHLFRTAGLPAPVVEIVTEIANTPQSPALDWAARTMISLKPLLDRIGATPRSPLDYDEMINGWRAGIADGAQLELPSHYGAWTRLP